MIHNYIKPVNELIEFVDSIVLSLYDDDKLYKICSGQGETLRKWHKKCLRDPYKGGQGSRLSQGYVVFLSQTKNWMIHNYIEQAERDTEKNGKQPIILYKSTNKKWLVIAGAEYILPLLADQNETTFLD